MTAVPDRLPIHLQPKQLRLYNAIRDRRPEAPKVIGFGGSRGAAKSGGVRRIALALAMEQPGIIVWIIRRVWDDLNKDHVKPFFEEQPWAQQYWHAVDRELKLPVGDGTSSIFFIHAGDAGRAKRKARGPQAHFIFLEQAEEFSQQEMEQLAGSNRAPGVPPGFCKRIFTFNPGGVGTSYLRRIFHKREYLDNERPENFLFIQGFGWDNFEWFRGLGVIDETSFYHGPEWVEEENFEFRNYPVRANRQKFDLFVNHTDFGMAIAGLPASQMIGELLGSFENFSGQYYADVWEESALFLPPDIMSRLVKPWWRRWLSTDWGFSHYAATYWWATGVVSPQECQDLFGIPVTKGIKVIVSYREAIVSDMTEPMLAQLIVGKTPESERREIRFHFIGQDAWAKRGSANTVVEQMDPYLTKAGMPRLSRADDDRVGGWRLMYNCWSETRKFMHWNSLDPFEQSEFPILFIGPDCSELRQAIPLLRAGDVNDNENPLDVIKVPGAIEDDVADGYRYGLKSFVAADPTIPAEVVAREIYQQYQDPTARAMAMLRLSAEREKGQRLFRRRRY